MEGRGIYKFNVNSP
jgi:hypothetical protein